MIKEHRLQFIDITKCIAIWLVLWGHAITELMPHDLSLNNVYVGIYSFHMPLFMLVSGLFAEKSFSMSFKDIAWKKFMQLILPTIAFFGISWWIIEHISLEGGILSYNLDDAIDIKEFIKHELSCYWFLKSLFICYLICWVCWKCGKWKWIAAGITLMGFLLLQKWNVTCFKMGYMLPFFLLGIIIKDKLQWIRDKSEHITILSAIIFFVGLHWYTLDYSFQAKMFQEISLQSIGAYMFYLLMGLSGSMMVIGVCTLLDKLMKKTEENKIWLFLSNIGTQTLGIYLWQKILLELLLPKFIQIDVPMGMYNFIITPLVATLFLILSHLSLKKMRKY